MARIAIFTGPPGCGKTQLMRELVEEDVLSGVVQSLTTRAPREGDARSEYLYTTPEEFTMIEGRRLLLWSTSYAGAEYGTMQGMIERARSLQGTYGLGVTPELAPIAARAAQASPIFYVDSSEHDLRRRLRQRGMSRSGIERSLVAHRDWALRVAAQGLPYVIVDGSHDAKLGLISRYLREYEQRRAS